MLKRVYLSFQWITAGLLVFLLPFTSFPLVARLTGSQMVAPLSLLPLGILLVAWYIPYLLRNGKLPQQSIPLFAFATAVLISAAAAFFIPFPAYKGATLVRSEAKALATLLVGICFYLVVAGWASQPARVRFVLRWINWGGAFMLGWSIFQVATWYRLHIQPDWMWNLQGALDTSLLLYAQRANGFAYEPSWLAHQLNMLYLPLWLSASVTGFTAHRFHIWKIHFEHLLLLGGVVVLVLSVSRIGLLTFLLMVAFLILLWNVRLVRWLQDRLSRSHASGPHPLALRRWVAVGCVLALLVVYAGMLGGAAYGLSRYDARMEKLFDFSQLKSKSFMYYANQLVFAERVVFWQAGWEVFNDYPVLGVGLGNAGYFFPQKLSAFSNALTEVRTLLYQWTTLPNIKSLWVRLLAETGVVGFSLFLSWGYVLWQSAQFLRRLGTASGSSLSTASGSALSRATGAESDDRMARTIGLAGSFVLIGFIIEGFSLDTFALPYYWLLFGLVTAACQFVCQSAAPSPLPEGLKGELSFLDGGMNE